MPRPLSRPSRDEVSPEDRADYDAALAYWFAPAADSGIANPDPGAANHLWAAAMMHSPSFSLHRAEGSRLLRTAPDREGSFSHSDREWVGQVLAVHLGTNVIQAVHVPDAVAVGVRPEAIRAVYAGLDEALSGRERLLADYVRQVVDGTVTDYSFDAVEEILGTRGVVEYTYYITMIFTVYRQVQAFGGRDFSDDEILEILRDAEQRTATR
jgi:alkylhydroperoxidase/carboxymuconolactone decarboxylase family protein YurZ